MLDRKIIACMDIKDNQVVKGVNFENIQSVGQVLPLVINYQKQGVDEIVLLDITASLEKRQATLDLVKQVSMVLDIPLTVGGGISSVQNAREILGAGASKVSINSSALANPMLISQIAQSLGKEALVVAIDVKEDQGQWWVYTKAGTQKTQYLAVDWAKKVEQLGAGEILLTSMSQDGCQSGFAIDVTKQVADAVCIEVTASGGAGAVSDFVEVFKQTKATKALAASIFHYNKVDIAQLKKQLRKNNIAVK